MLTLTQTPYEDRDFVNLRLKNSRFCQMVNECTVLSVGFDLLQSARSSNGCTGLLNERVGLLERFRLSMDAERAYRRCQILIQPTAFGQKIINS